MKGMFKRALAGVAAAALAVTGLALGAGAANAAEGDLVLGTSITFNATDTDQFNGRDLQYVKLADFTEYAGEGVASSLGITTEDDPVKAAVLTALEGTGYVAATDGDPMTWVANNLTDSNTAPNYTGKLRDFVQDLYTALGDDAFADVTLSDDGVSRTFDTRDAGIYLIVDKGAASQITDGKSVTQAIPMLVATPVSAREGANPAPQIPSNADGVVNLKNETTTVTKTVKDEGAAGVNDKRTYTINNTTVPNWVNKDVDAEGDDAPVFTYTDTPSKGQTVNFDKNFTVKVGDETLAWGTDFTVTVHEGEDVTAVAANDGSVSMRAGDGKYFVIDLTGWMKKHAQDAAYIGKTIVISYTTTINSDALKEGASLTNTVKVDNDGSFAQDATDPDDVPTPKSFTFTKVQGDGTTGLAGAKFTVSKGDAPVKLVAKGNGVYDVYEEGSTDDSTTEIVTPETGVVAVNGLGDGVYTVTETSAPEGYMGYNDADSKVLTFTVNIVNGVVTYEKGDDIFGLVSGFESSNVVVKNVNNITQLPLTGAAGTMLFTVLGLLIAGAGALVYMKSRSVKHMLRG